MWFTWNLFLAAWVAKAADNFADSITFFGLNKEGTSFIASSEIGSTLKWCDVNDKFAIVTHGWLGSCNGKLSTMTTVLSNLQKARGGCILCMDYRNYSLTLDRSALVRNYDGIQAVLVNKLVQLKNEGFQPSKGYMYAHSIGAILIINSAILAFGNRTFGMTLPIIRRRFDCESQAIVPLSRLRLGVDCGGISILNLYACDPSGLKFDGTSRAPKDSSQAAINVQCIHTSVDFGTKLRTCTQNWLMGICGVYQPGASLIENSHVLCPDFYNSAFTNSFPAISRPWYCPKTDRSLTNWPNGYRIGYDESRLIPNSQPFGTLYACTSKEEPYTCSKNSHCKRLPNL